MDPSNQFVDFLAERRKDFDLSWFYRTVNELAPHKIPPEAKYSRKEIINAVINDPRVKMTILCLAASRGVDVAIVKGEAYAMINEMASKSRLITVRCLGYLITKTLKRLFSSIYINENTMLTLKKEMQISQVQYIYAPTHRSYMDFVIVSYILHSYGMALPNIASGMDFYQMRIVGELLRDTGAFYMRRSFSYDTLYKNVFRAYITNILSHTDKAIEFFIEGTRSRSMKSIVPKYGLLSIILETLLDGNVPDIHFIPISINYDRPLEELLFAYELLGVPKPKESTMGLVKSLSLLTKPSAYSNVFFNIGEHISALEFLSTSQRKAKILTPSTKVSSTAVEELADYIMNSHKKNTIITPFNVISLLFNENVQINPDAPYTLDKLVEDYAWCKSTLVNLCNVTFSTSITATTESIIDTKSELLKALEPHSDLLILDTLNTIRLKQRHQKSKIQKGIRVKAHDLSPETMCIAVSAINLTVYVNPVLALIIKPVIAVVAIGMSRIQCDTAFERYKLLRTVLSTEFAMRLSQSESELYSEWNETINMLTKENCIHREDTIYIPGQNIQLFSLLYNLLLPFIDALYIACLVLFEWNESVLGELTNRAYLMESQKRAEEALFKGNTWGQHPYSLSLDLYNSTWTNFLSQRIIIADEQPSKYRADKIRLAQYLMQLERLALKRPPGSYTNLTLLNSSPNLVSVQAKL